MKNKILLLHFLTATFFAHAQNVGVGTTTPLSKLHVYNGASGASPFALSPLVVESSGHTYINLLSPASNETGVLFGQPGSSANGVIMYNNEYTPNGFQFRNNGNLIRMVIDDAGKVGIGIVTPQFPLSFNGTLGDKISLWADGTPTHYGFGIQAGLFQVFSKTFNDDIAFGYGSSTLFTERMRIKGNGNVGIGNSTPGYQLDISGRVRIRSGGNNTVSAGLWLNNNANTEAAFIGMEDDTHVGLFGTTAGWRFGMNTQTGALKINGSEGQPGQFLQSSGNAAPEWTNNPVTEMYNLTEEIACTGPITLVSTTEGDVPGLTKSLVLAKPAKVAVQFMIFSQSVGCAFCSGSTFDIVILLDGVNTGRVRNEVGNGTTVHVTGTRIFTLPAGTHAIKIVGRNLSGPNLVLGPAGAAYPSFLTIQAIPQN
ncbi:MAG: hypothetical protein ABI707_02575 [Ferruginibacter sp.]